MVVADVLVIAVTAKSARTTITLEVFWQCGKANGQQGRPEVIVINSEISFSLLPFNCRYDHTMEQMLMPKGLRSVLYHCRGVGVLFQLSALVDFVIVPAVHEWFVYNAHYTRTGKISKSHCNEATELVALYFYKL